MANKNNTKSAKLRKTKELLNMPINMNAINPNNRQAIGKDKDAKAATPIADAKVIELYDCIVKQLQQEGNNGMLSWNQFKAHFTPPYKGERFGGYVLQALKEHLGNVENGTIAEPCFKSVVNGITIKAVQKIIDAINKQKKPTSSLIPIKGISKVMQARLRDLDIMDAASLLARGNTVDKRKALADRLSVDVRVVNTWVKQADLWRVEGMTTDLAYLLVLAGIRNVEDLAQADEKKITPILNGFCATQIDFEFDANTIPTAIENAKELVAFGNPVREIDINGMAEFLKGRLQPSNRRDDADIEPLINLIKEYQDAQKAQLLKKSTHRQTEDEEPTHLFVDDDDETGELELLNGRAITRGLGFLDDIQFALPLPRRISGTVTIRKKNEIIDPKKTDSVYYRGCTRLSGAMVEISGIVSPSDDQKEANVNPSCVTDGNGKFVIVLPERYSMKDTLTITISQGSNKQEFIKSAPEIIEAVKEQKTLNLFYKLDALGDEIDYIDDQITQIKEKLASIQEQEADLNKDDEDTAKELARLAEQKDEYNELLWGNTQKGVSGYYADKRQRMEEYDTLKKELIRKSGISPYSSKGIKEAFEHFINNISNLEARLEGEDFSPNVKDEGFIIIEEVFKGERTDVEKALPKVKLMGNDEKTVHLSTDTAPSRIHTYGMLQRLVEPDITGEGRKALVNPIDVMDFKKKMAENPNSFPQASSLGMGYILNMHQAWVPDGFALGDLLYSLVLAPGEEQRLIVRENKQTYAITDEAEAIDADSESYAMTQDDDTTAAFNYAMDQLSSGKSSYSYSASSWSVGGSASGGIGGAMLGLSGGYSKSSGKGSSSASQSNAHSEASSAAQNFQHNIKSASDKISQAKRVSMEMATSEVSDSVATKIIANHNHSHAMTIQYWEVMRRYKLETCIDNIDLVLFVPLKLVRFLPAHQSFYVNDTANFNKTAFANRYNTLLRYYDTLYYRLSYKYRTGLSLIKKYAAYPKWEMENISEDMAGKEITLTLEGSFLEFDNLKATLVLANGKGRIAGRIVQNLQLRDTLGQGAENDDDLSIEGLITKYRIKTEKELKQLIANIRNEVTHEIKISFKLMSDISEQDLSYISIQKGLKPVNYRLHEGYVIVRDDKNATVVTKDESWSEAQLLAVEHYMGKLTDLYQDNKGSSGDRKSIAHYSTGLPENFLTNYVNDGGTLTATALRPYSEVILSDCKMKGVNGNEIEGAAPSSYSIDDSITINLSNRIPVLRYNEFQKMEETLQHICTNPILYSQVIWASLNDDERVLMLEQYTIDMNFNLLSDDDSNEEKVEKNQEDMIPLLNCINVKNMMGFYGNCMIFPFTFPQRLAKRLGKTAANIQDSLYRYHSNNFRVPTTTISLPTKGMIGEAVLGETNVSEEIDLTRFWNWQDSPIDKMEIDSSYLNGTDYLQGKSTKDVTSLNMQGATAATPVTVPDLVSALVNKQTPAFDNITGLDQLKEVLNAGTTSAAAGRDKVISSSAELVKSALSALKQPSGDKTDGNESDGIGNGEDGSQGENNATPLETDPNSTDSGEKTKTDAENQNTGINAFKALLERAIIAFRNNDDAWKFYQEETEEETITEEKKKDIRKKANAYCEKNYKKSLNELIKSI